MSYPLARGLTSSLRPALALASSTLPQQQQLLSTTTPLPSSTFFSRSFSSSPLLSNTTTTTEINAVPPTTPSKSIHKLGVEEWAPSEHIIWTQEEMEGVQQTHKEPVKTWDHLAFTGTKVVRAFFDVASGYSFGPITEKKLLRRIVFLETVAGIPGMVAGSLRHLKSLRRIERDMGWIQTLLDEAENERMHLLVFREIARPSIFTKTAVFFSQIIAWNAFFSFYLIAPKACHRFVGYIEEEAVHTYTGAINLLREGKLPLWQNKPCPPAGIEYWGLKKDATMEDLLLAVRADEAHHRDVNHMFADIQPTDPNPMAKRPLPKTP